MSSVFNTTFDASDFSGLTWDSSKEEKIKKWVAKLKEKDEEKEEDEEEEYVDEELNGVDEEDSYVLQDTSGFHQPPSVASKRRDWSDWGFENKMRRLGMNRSIVRTPPPPTQPLYIYNGVLPSSQHIDVELDIPSFGSSNSSSPPSPPSPPIRPSPPIHPSHSSRSTDVRLRQKIMTLFVVFSLTTFMSFLFLYYSPYMFTTEHVNSAYNVGYSEGRLFGDFLLHKGKLFYENKIFDMNECVLKNTSAYCDKYYAGIVDGFDDIYGSWLPLVYYIVSFIIINVMALFLI